MRTPESSFLTTQLLQRPKSTTTLAIASNTNYYSLFCTRDSEDARAQFSHHTALAEVKIAPEAVEPVPSVGSKRRGSAVCGIFWRGNFELLQGLGKKINQDLRFKN
jgi:hypothetical protein